MEKTRFKDISEKGYVRKRERERGGGGWGGRRSIRSVKITWHRADKDDGSELKQMASPPLRSHVVSASEQ